MTGRAEATNFSSYHQTLNRARWDTHAMARRLLIMIIDRLVPDGPVVIGMDDTIERRWVRKITARGIYRDTVRSSHGHFVKPRQPSSRPNGRPFCRLFPNSNTSATQMRAEWPDQLSNGRRGD